MSHEASGLKQDRKKVGKSAFFMAAGTLTSRILGLFRDMALAALFDRTITDAWTVAFRLPNLFRRLFGEGSLSVSFIPVFIQAQNEDPRGPRAQNLLNTLYTLLIIVMGSVTLLGVIYTEPLLKLMLSSEYWMQSEKWLLTLRMSKIMFGFVYFICTYAYFMGILNALGSYGLPALAAALLNISMLVFTFLPADWFPQKGDGLAWGVLIGGALQALLLWNALRKRGCLPRFSMARSSNNDLRRVLTNMLPGIVGIGLLQFSTLVNLYYSSGLGEGVISYIYWADRLLEFPLSIISVSLGSALLPTLSELYVKNENQKFQQTFEDHFILNFLLVVPAALGLFWLADPIIEILFKRGHFTMLDVQGTAIVLKIYALSMIVISGVRVTAPAFHALRNTWIPGGTSFLGLALHLLFASWWIKYAGLKGLVTSSFIAMLVQFLLMITALRIFIVKLDWEKLTKEIFKILICGAVLSVVAHLYYYFTSLLPEQESAHNLLIKMSFLILTVGFAACSYFICAYLLNIEQAVRLGYSIKTNFFRSKNKE